MKTRDIRVCILRIEGTNCEDESMYAFQRLGAKAEQVHLKQLTGSSVEGNGPRSLEDYQVLFIPGGFSSGDYVRAGAIFASRIKSELAQELTQFIDDGYPVGGVCNGFQVLVELGALPGFAPGLADAPEAVLMTNDSSRFECRPTLLKVESKSGPWTRRLKKGEVIQVPVAHAEGKFAFPQGEEEALLDMLVENEQICFRYVGPDGDYADYPYNPNGSLDNIAGITNEAGNVFGMMPHPERVFFRNRMSDWTRVKQMGGGTVTDGYGPGKQVFDGVLAYVRNKF
ncbi:MAG: phosphoribosylformylglycinamidine synthase subunit PurQ [Thermoplasmata archaeon]|nr:MAG: phosphoribosylformylglycinamidine synthase subunit PurQ [Thermoplasmata archaeon]